MAKTFIVSVNIKINYPVWAEDKESAKEVFHTLLDDGEIDINSFPLETNIEDVNEEV